MSSRSHVWVRLKEETVETRRFWPRLWGNGRATAVLLASEGAKVLAADINLGAAVETKRIIEG